MIYLRLATSLFAKKGVDINDAVIKPVEGKIKQFGCPIPAVPSRNRKLCNPFLVNDCGPSGIISMMPGVL